ncbi:hypothetical protein ACQSSU_20365 [Micromonospora echinospora]
MTSLINLYAGDTVPANPAHGFPVAFDILARDTVPCADHDPDDWEATDPAGYVARCPECAVRWHVLRDNGIATRETLPNRAVYGEPGQTTRIVVRPGQVWADYDRRAPRRQVRILSLDGTHATVELVGHRGRPARGHEDQQVVQPGHQTTIRLDRFGPTSTGYVLVSDVDPEPAAVTAADLTRLVERYGDAVAQACAAASCGGLEDMQEAGSRAGVLLARVRRAIEREFGTLARARAEVATWDADHGWDHHDGAGAAYEAVAEILRPGLPQAGIVKG